MNNKIKKGFPVIDELFHYIAERHDDWNKLDPTERALQIEDEFIINRLESLISIYASQKEDDMKEENKEEKPKWWQPNWFDEFLETLFERFKKMGIMIGTLVLVSLIPIRCHQTMKSGNKNFVDSLFDSTTEFVSMVSSVANSEEADIPENSEIKPKKELSIEILKSKYKIQPDNKLCEECSGSWFTHTDIEDEDFGRVYILKCGNCGNYYLDLYQYGYSQE